MIVGCSGRCRYTRGPIANTVFQLTVRSDEEKTHQTFQTAHGIPSMAPASEYQGYFPKVVKALGQGEEGGRSYAGEHVGRALQPPRLRGRVLEEPTYREDAVPSAGEPVTCRRFDDGGIYTNALSYALLAHIHLRSNRGWIAFIDNACSSAPSYPVHQILQPCRAKLKPRCIQSAEDAHQVTVQGKAKLRTSGVPSNAVEGRVTLPQHLSGHILRRV